MTPEEIVSAPVRFRGNTFEDFQIGHIYKHHWGRTIRASDNVLFCSSSLQINPIYFNRTHAQAMGHRDIVVAPMLVFSVVFGLSVEDLSERGGAFLGIEKLSFHEPVYEEDTLTAQSTVAALRESRSDLRHGIATWHTQGFNQHGALVVDFHRSNLVIRREYAQ